jgi:hypothetical protein
MAAGRLWALSGLFPFVIASFGHNFTLNGSSAIAIRTLTEIIVGTDSIGVYSGGAMGSIPVCKIHQFGNTFFTHTGLYQYSGTGFDVVSVASEACHSNRPLFTQVQTFESLMRDRLTKTMEYIKTNEAQSYKDNYLDKRVIDVAFWGIEGGAPLLYTRVFDVTNSASGTPLVTIRKQDCPGDCPDEQGYIPLGESDAIQNYVRQNPAVFRQGLINAVNTLIKVQTDATPNKVGGDIDIVRTTRSATEWIQRKSSCLEIKK